MSNKKTLFSAFNSDSESDSGAPAAKPAAKKTNPAVEAAKKRNPDLNKAKVQPAAAPQQQKEQVKEQAKPQRVFNEAVNKSAPPKKRATKVVDRDPERADDKEKPVFAKRGGRGGAAAGRGGRERGREFDRRSGTGRGREMKRHGAGANNWGQPGDELAPQAVTPTAGTEEKEEEKDKEEEEAVVEEEKEKEPEVFTMEEYLKRKQEKRSGALFQANNTDFEVEEVKEGRVYAKKDREETNDEAYIKLSTTENKPKPGATKKKEAKKVTVKGTGFTVRVDEPPAFRDRGDRRERGGDRSRPGRGDFRGGRGGYKPRGGAAVASGAPRAERGVDTSETNFPTLGK